MTTQVCKTCGFILISSRKKCPNCGKALVHDTSKELEEIWPEKDVKVFQNKRSQTPNSQPERQTNDPI